MKNFYLRFFKLKANKKYYNKRKNFSSYFLSFESGARLELMHKPEIMEIIGESQKIGLAHFAISVGSRQKVDALTELIRESGFEVLGEPRTTGDGYYESVVTDPEGNHIEITI